MNTYWLTCRDGPLPAPDEVSWLSDIQPVYYRYWGGTSTLSLTHFLIWNGCGTYWYYITFYVGIFLVLFANGFIFDRCVYIYIRYLYNGLGQRASFCQMNYRSTSGRAESQRPLVNANTSYAPPSLLYVIVCMAKCKLYLITCICLYTIYSFWYLIIYYVSVKQQLNKQRTHLWETTYL